MEAEGILCEVRGEHLVPAYGEVPMTFDTLPSIWVEDGYRPSARQRIEQALHGRVTGIKWICPGCDEELAAQFSDCWNCGAPRPLPPD